MPPQSGGLRVGKIILQRVLAPIGLPKKAHRQVYIDTSEWEKSHQRSVPLSEKSQQRRNRVSTSEWGKSHQRGVWMDEYRNRL